MLVHIASSRPIGERCLKWARANSDATFTDDPERSEVFMSVMYGHLVSEQFIAGRRCYNFHPGILPQYRGAGAFSWAIINGEKKCGITLHELDVDIDTGPIIAVQSFAVESWDTAGTLYAKGMEAMFSLFTAHFDRLLKGNYEATPQDNGKAHTYYRKDLAKAQDLTRVVRAFAFDGKPPAYYVDRAGKKIEVMW